MFTWETGKCGTSLVIFSCTRRFKEMEEDKLCIVMILILQLKNAASHVIEHKRKVETI
jgi:hypothetical protein